MDSALQADSGSKAEHRRDPWSLRAAVDLDLAFAAGQTVAYALTIRARHQHLRGMFRELSRRCRPLSGHLRWFQPTHVKRVAGKLSLGLVAVACLLMLWADCRMVGRFLGGFQVLERLEESNLWDLAEFPDPEPSQVVLERFVSSTDIELNRSAHEDWKCID